MIEQIEKMECLQVLTPEELEGISGGESGWYWIAYHVGTFISAVADQVARSSHNTMTVGPGVPIH